jgi:hypothetical protein
MALEIAGKIVSLLPEQTGTGKNGNWVKQDFVIETVEQYPKKVCFSAWGDKAAQVKGLQSGQSVKVSFNVESREFNGKWYTDLRIWKLETSSGNNESISPPADEITDFNTMSNTMRQLDTEGGKDDLPF